MLSVNQLHIVPNYFLPEFRFNKENCLHYRDKPNKHLGCANSEFVQSKFTDLHQNDEFGFFILYGRNEKDHEKNRKTALLTLVINTLFFQMIFIKETKTT